MRIEPNSLVGGFPALTIRKLVRRLNGLQCRNVETLRMILRTEGGAAEAIVGALVEASLAAGRDAGSSKWTARITGTKPDLTAMRGTGRNIPPERFIFGWQ